MTARGDTRAEVPSTYWHDGTDPTVVIKLKAWRKIDAEFMYGSICCTLVKRCLFPLLPSTVTITKSIERREKGSTVWAGNENKHDSCPFQCERRGRRRCSTADEKVSVGLILLFRTFIGLDGRITWSWEKVLWWWSMNFPISCSCDKLNVTFRDSLRVFNSLGSYYYKRRK